jgi:hypothetical protein
MIMRNEFRKLDPSMQKQPKARVLLVDDGELAVPLVVEPLLEILESPLQEALRTVVVPSIIILTLISLGVTLLLVIPGITFVSFVTLYLVVGVAFAFLVYGACAFF